MNNTEVIKTPSNKAELLTKNIAYISRLDEKKKTTLYPTSAPQGCISFVISICRLGIFPDLSKALTLTKATGRIKFLFFLARTLNLEGV